MRRIIEPGRRLSPGPAGPRGVRRDPVGPDHIREICEEVARGRGDPPIWRASQCDPKVRFFVEAGVSRVE